MFRTYNKGQEEMTSFVEQTLSSVPMLLSSVVVTSDAPDHNGAKACLQLAVFQNYFSVGLLNPALRSFQRNGRKVPCENEDDD